MLNRFQQQFLTGQHYLIQNNKNKKLKDLIDKVKVHIESNAKNKWGLSLNGDGDLQHLSKKTKKKSANKSGKELLNDFHSTTTDNKGKGKKYKDEMLNLKKRGVEAMVGLSKIVKQSSYTDATYQGMAEDWVCKKYDDDKFTKKERNELLDAIEDKPGKWVRCMRVALASDLDEKEIDRRMERLVDRILD